MRAAAVSRRGRRSTAVIAALSASVAMAACGGDGGESGSMQEPGGGERPADSVKTNRVRITDFKYKPADAEVKVGSKVTFVNDDTAAHTATSTASPRVFDTDSIRRGESKSVTPEKAGDFDYHCAFHPFMKAKIRVVK